MFHSCETEFENWGSFGYSRRLVQTPQTLAMKVFLPQNSLALTRIPRDNVPKELGAQSKILDCQIPHLKTSFQEWLLNCVPIY